MLRLEIPENTAYNCMIYIPFFIVILIDKRGVREAERGGKRKPLDTILDTIYKQSTPRTAPRSHRAATAQRKRGMAPHHTTTPPTAAHRL